MIDLTKKGVGNIKEAWTIEHTQAFDTLRTADHVPYPDEARPNQTLHVDHSLESWLRCWYIVAKDGRWKGASGGIWNNETVGGGDPMVGH